MWKMCKKIVEDELNGVDDNPLTVKTKDESYIYHGAHFHGQYIGYAMDWLKIPLIQLAQLSDRRTARLIDANYNDGLTDLLASSSSGLSCAFEGLQYSSTSVVAEMKTMSAPASIQSIPSNLNNQDIVSMGMIAARQTWETTKNALIVVSVEIRTALQAIELRVREQNNLPFNYDFEHAPERKKELFEKLMGKRLYKVYKEFMSQLDLTFVQKDRYLADELNNLQAYIFARMFPKDSEGIQVILNQMTKEEY